MASRNHKDAAFNNLLHNVLEGTEHAAELAHEVTNDHNEQLVALQRYFTAMPAKGFVPGQLVQWKAGMQNRRMPRPGEPAIVMEVLNPPVFDNDEKSHGSNMYREPLTLVLGIQDKDGDFLTFHYDGRRFELLTNTGDKP